MQIDGRIVRTYYFEVPRRLCNYLVSLASPEFWNYRGKVKIAGEQRLSIS